MLRTPTTQSPPKTSRKREECGQAKLLAHSDASCDMSEIIGPASNDATELARLRSRVIELEAKLAQPGVADENVLMHAYLSASPLKMLRGRLPWLVVLLLLQSTAALVMRSFEDLLDRELVIAFFVPMIVGTGGNAGNQPGVAVTRALGLGGARDRTVLRRILVKEASLAVCTASVLAAVAFVRVFAAYSADLKAAAAIAIAVFVMVEISIILGVCFSILIDMLNIDPANGAAPLLTTVTDLVGITVLCGVSVLFFGAVGDAEDES